MPALRWRDFPLRNTTLGRADKTLADLGRVPHRFADVPDWAVPASDMPIPQGALHSGQMILLRFKLVDIRLCEGKPRPRQCAEIEQ